MICVTFTGCDWFVVFFLSLFGKQELHYKMLELEFYFHVSIYSTSKSSTRAVPESQLDSNNFISEQRNLCHLESNRASEPVISSDDNTSCVSMHEMAHSFMHYSFIPDSDSVYLDKDSVCVHDKAVRNGIIPFPYDIQCSSYVMRKGLQIIWMRCNNTGKKSCLGSFFYTFFHTITDVQ